MFEVFCRMILYQPPENDFELYISISGNLYRMDNLCSTLTYCSIKMSMFMANYYGYYSDPASGQQT